ncbi:hypothetical protein WJX74_010315 [Apatococcus lobatus]|uniref:Micro-fibrillar-associated protein 1 C-terminal domain-containing protein n=1 Tax=Apatococcus lobatus TaxID=904363 RepID=A0AAW1SHH1_9CHLO
MAGRRAEKEVNTNRIDPASVKRYWPGKAPDWAKALPAEEEEEAAAASQSSDEEGLEADKVAAPVILKKSDDPRLRRLAEAQAEVGGRDTALARRRDSSARVVEDGLRPDADELVGTRRGDDAEEEDEELIAARRQAVRDRLRKQQEAQPAADDELEEEEEDEEAGSSEYETDSEEEYGRQMLKPVFVPKSNRETIEERDALEKEEAEALVKHKHRLEDRKKETKEIVVERIRAEEAAARGAREGPKELGDIHTDDEEDEEAEYELWRQRELRRIRRDREEKEREIREGEERDMLKNMSAEERAAWERDHPKMDGEAPKKKWRFLQKYWHKGAFFQEASDNPYTDEHAENIFRRDYSNPTGEDKMDKTVLPKIMQVKNFGRRGRTKWTHLVNEDTTEFDNEIAPTADIRKKFVGKTAGTQDVFENPPRPVR